MNNRRPILFFVVGTLLLGGLLVWLEMRARQAVPDARGGVLCEFMPERVDACFIQRGQDEVNLVREADGTWRLVRPFSVMADAAAVARLIDALTLVPVTDMRSEGELLEMNETLADFGIGTNAFAVTLGAGGRQTIVSFGNVSPSGTEVYAHVEGSRSICALPRDAFDRIPRDVDDFRERGVLACPRDEISGLDIRVPDKPAVRLARAEGGWAILSPAAVPADGAAVGALVDCLAAAQVMAFEMPSRAHPSVPTGGIRADDLVSYGLDAGLSVTVRGAADYTEQIMFGRSAGTNLVWALVRNGTAVVSVDAALAERCRADSASLRDTRVFPFAEGETVTSVSFRRVRRRARGRRARARERLHHRHEPSRPRGVGRAPGREGRFRRSPVEDAACTRPRDRAAAVGTRRIGGGDGGAPEPRARRVGPRARRGGV